MYFLKYCGIDYPMNIENPLMNLLFSSKAVQIATLKETDAYRTCDVGETIKLKGEQIKLKKKTSKIQIIVLIMHTHIGKEKAI
jgi:hypothetical protein